MQWFPTCSLKSPSKSLSDCFFYMHTVYNMKQIQCKVLRNGTHVFFCIVSGVAESSSPAISGVPWIICISWMMWGPVHNQLNFTVYKLLTPPNPTIHTQIKPSSLKMMNLKKMNYRCHSIHRKLPQVHDNPCNATSLLTLVGTVVVKVSCIKINTLI